MHQYVLGAQVMWRRLVTHVLMAHLELVLVVRCLSHEPFPLRGQVVAGFGAGEDGLVRLVLAGVHRAQEAIARLGADPALHGFTKAVQDWVGPLA